jgi:hypothetical protein
MAFEGVPINMFSLVRSNILSLTSTNVLIHIWSRQPRSLTSNAMIILVVVLHSTLIRYWTLVPCILWFHIQYIYIYMSSCQFDFFSLKLTHYIAMPRSHTLSNYFSLSSFTWQQLLSLISNLSILIIHILNLSCFFF